MQLVRRTKPTAATRQTAAIRHQPRRSSRPKTGNSCTIVSRACRRPGTCSLTSADRDDLLADILLEILHHDAAVLRGFAGRSSLATYLAVVGRRVAVRGLAKIAEKNHGRQPLDDGHAAGHVDDGHSLMADREELETMLRSLDEVEARLVRLHHLEARSYGEISRLTGMPLGSIGPTLARARQKMKLHSEQQQRGGGTPGPTLNGEQPG